MLRFENRKHKIHYQRVQKKAEDAGYMHNTLTGVMDKKRAIKL